ncbi:peptide-methionine (S)-S-oxide reductase MsrA [Halioxenophilus aromaticivorans]|uniref:Peptide methionine sulfoxide reductase MsrA n=1 Tax=Halioxenophilus aromaticivorans TaxID=1306992 RepID=A0AAV3TWB1_9ALTE
MFGRKVISIPAESECLPGRDETMPVPDEHRVLKTPLKVQDDRYDTITVGMGCFWGAERLFWRMDGVYSTAVGYAGGVTPNPSYDEVCSGRTAHTEVVKVVYDPHKINLEKLLKTFWEEHDPTQGFRQGNDLGTQYRSAIYYTNDAQGAVCKRAAERYQAELSHAGRGDITTEVEPLKTFYYAEPYHQQYLDKNPNGYCGLAGTGVKCK